MEEKKKRRHSGGASDGREEEAGMSNPHTSFDSNRASIILATIEQEYGTSDGKSQCCCTKNLMRHPPASDFG